jgi:hypothetical protein
VSVLRSFLALGAFFLGGGLIATVGGALALTRFLRERSLWDDISLLQFVTGMILPHVCMFFGVLVLTYGVILIAKESIIARRQSH